MPDSPIIIKANLHDFVHGLLHEILAAWEPVTEGRVQVVAQV